MNHRLNRRTLLGTGMTAAALGGLAVTGCTTELPTDPGEDPTAASLPDHVPLTPTDPDLPGTPEGVDPAYFSYPTSPVAITDTSPGDGSSVTFMTQGGTPPPPPEQNSYWAGLNERLNLDVQMNMSPADQYAAKLSTTIAGGDIPDVVQFPVWQPQMGSLLRGEFADLSDLLAGDNIQQYPALASLPTTTWRAGQFGGRIYGVPRPLSAMGQVTFTRADLLEEAGLDPQPGSFEEFRALCGDLTDPRANTWASSQPLPLVEFVVEMLGGSIHWQQQADGFVHGFETEEYTQALDAVVSLLDDGVFHPDWASATLANAAQFYRAGSIKLLRENFPVWTNLTRSAALAKDEDRFEIDAILPPKFDSGSTARKNLGTPTFGFAALSQAPTERLDMILKVMNWLASPFGSAEQQYVAYGEEGVDHTRVDGEPVLTEVGATQVRLVLSYVAYPSTVIYVPGHAEVARAQHEFQTAVIPDSVSDASYGIESDALVSKNAALGTLMTNLQNDILSKRKPVSSWSEAVGEWRSQGGDEIRQELEAAVS